MKTIAQLREILAKERESIPKCNQAKFDIESEDFLDIVKKASDSSRYHAFSAHMYGRILIHRTTDTSKAPPILIRKYGESADEHMERCYKAGGYGP